MLMDIETKIYVIARNIKIKKEEENIYITIEHFPLPITKVDSQIVG